MGLTLWHNPRCSKSRAAHALLEERGVAFDVRLYLTDPPDEAELRRINNLLGRPLIDMVRTGDAAFKDTGLRKDIGDDALIAAMVKHPALIERPILVSEKRAVIGRPPEDVLALL